MVALGSLNPIDDVRARLQEQIANFLAARARLQRLMNNPSLQVQGQAQGLYAVQVALENRLQDEIAPKVQAIQSGVWTTSDLITLGGFTGQIVKQLNDVSSLERAVGITSQGGMFDTSTMVLAVPVILIAGLLGGLILARR